MKVEGCGRRNKSCEHLYDELLNDSHSAGMRAVYCHATSKDAAKADPIGDVRAEKMARAAKAAGIEHIVYNSSGKFVRPFLSL